MSKLGAVVEAVEKHGRFVLEQVKRARSDEKFGRALTERWNKIKSETPITRAPTGLPLPRFALPEVDEPGEIARYLFGDGLPGEFPFLNGAYREMYLEPIDEIEQGSYGNKKAPSSNGHKTQKKNGARPPEEPTCLFSGLMLAEDTNKRFHFLSAHQRSKRLSTAFDGPTLYGIDSDADGVFGKIGEGGVAVDTVEDMIRLYDGFEVGSPDFSASMTISGPAPMIMAMYIAAAKRRFGPSVVPNLRGTIQADIFKEVQAQNETIFPIEASLRFLCDMIEWTTASMPRWYPISISGYHIGEAGSTPVQQAAYTLSNGFAYAEMLTARGASVDQFGPRLSFFLDCGLDVEYIALARVSRKIWAIGMRDVFGAGSRAQMFKLHTQTSGRSLIAAEFKNNLTRTAAELMLAYMNGTNSSHSNSADEPFTTPSEEWIRLAAHGQAILLEESGIFKHTMNMLSGSPGMKAVERAVEKAVLDEFREIESLGGVLAAVENRYQRSQIQNAAHRYEQQIYDGKRPIIGLNRYRNGSDEMPEIELARTPRAKQKLQVDRLKKFKSKNADRARRALDKLAAVVETDENSFPALLEAAEVCSLGQITGRLQEIVGRFVPWCEGPFLGVPLRVKVVTQARSVGRDSVEPKKLPVRRNPAAGVHVLGDRTTIVFLTVCTLNRASGLATIEVHTALTDAWNGATSWLVGAYVIMPNHLHLFCAPQTTEVSIEHWITFWKRQFRRRCSSAPRLQSRGFHHRLRRGENYSEKWEYVQRNPVRSGLVRDSDDWHFKGVLNNLPWW